MKNNQIRGSLSRLLLALALVLLGFTVFSADVWAQNYRAGIGGPYGRTFPDVALRGSFKVLVYPVVEIDGKQERIAPGTRIIDTSNRIIMPATITGRNQVVNYVRSANGQLNTVWIITAKEAREPRQVANPKWWHNLYDNFETWVDMAKWLGLTQVGL